MFRKFYMKFLPTFLFLMFSFGFVSADNVSVDDVGSTYVFIENQRDSIVKVDVLSIWESSEEDPLKNVCSLKKGDSEIFYLGSPSRKNWRSKKTQLISIRPVMNNFVQIYDSNDNPLFEFDYRTRLARQDFNLSQEVFSNRFTLFQCQQVDKYVVFDRAFTGNILGFDLADIYFVKIVITNQGADVNLVQKILKIGNPMPKIEFSENKF